MKPTGGRRTDPGRSLHQSWQLMSVTQSPVIFASVELRRDEATHPRPAGPHSGPQSAARLQISPQEAPGSDSQELHDGLLSTL